MEDRVAPRFRPLTQGMPAKVPNSVELEVSEKPLEDGVEKRPGVLFGVPTGPVMPAEPVAPAKCTATTKEGNPCKAYATKASKLCVGHSDKS